MFVTQLVTTAATDSHESCVTSPGLHIYCLTNHKTQWSLCHKALWEEAVTMQKESTKWACKPSGVLLWTWHLLENSGKKQVVVIVVVISSDSPYCFVCKQCLNSAHDVWMIQTRSRWFDYYGNSKISAFFPCQYFMPTNKIHNHSNMIQLKNNNHKHLHLTFYCFFIMLSTPILLNVKLVKYQCYISTI